MHYDNECYLVIIIIIIITATAADVCSYAISSCQTSTTPCDASGPACLRPPFSSTRNGTPSSATLR